MKYGGVLGFSPIHIGDAIEELLLEQVSFSRIKRMFR